MTNPLGSEQNRGVEASSEYAQSRLRVEDAQKKLGTDVKDLKEAQRKKILKYAGYTAAGVLGTAAVVGATVLATNPAARETAGKFIKEGAGKVKDIPGKMINLRFNVWDRASEYAARFPKTLRGKIANSLANLVKFA